MQAAENSYARAYPFHKDFWREIESRVSRRYEEQETNVRPFAGRFGFESIDLASVSRGSGFQPR